MRKVYTGGIVLFTGKSEQVDFGENALLTVLGQPAQAKGCRFWCVLPRNELRVRRRAVQERMFATYYCVGEWLQVLAAKCISPETRATWMGKMYSTIKLLMLLSSTPAKTCSSSGRARIRTRSLHRPLTVKMAMVGLGT